MKNKKILKNVIAVMVTFGIITATLLGTSAATVFGDIDGDGKVTATDARLILRASAGLENLGESNEIGRVTGDIDGDGKVTATDARIVLMVSAGLETIAAPTTKKEQTTQSKEEISSILAVFNEAANQSKKYDGKMKVDATQGTNYKLHDFSGTAITGLADLLFPSDYPKTFSKTYENGVNIEDSEDTLKSLMAPVEEDYMSQLTAEGVDKATMTKTATGTKIVINLVKETGKSMDYVPPHHSSCSDPVLLKAKSIQPLYSINNPIIIYPGAKITATINEFGLLSAFSIDENVCIVGTLSIALISNSNFDIEGRWRQSLAIVYDGLDWYDN